MKNFYRKFQTISKFPLWPNYLRWVYKKTIDDPVSLGIKPISKRKEFSCLLCGVSGEITAEEYIKFVLKINSEAKIMIIDIGEDQTGSVQKLVKEKFPKANIIVKRANALDLSFIKDKSLDWIDTDGFFSFFDEKQLMDLFSEWKRMLKNDGYITFRELVSSGFVSKTINILRAKSSQVYMGIKLNLHSLNELTKKFNTLGFKCSRGHSPILFLDRYCLTNSP